MAAPTKPKQSLRRLVPVSDDDRVDCELNENAPLIALKVNRAISKVEVIGPQDGIEDLLARQMVGVNQAIHSCLGIA